MAEGWARSLRADLVEPHSAGLEPHGLHPDAVRAMAEVGIDISGQRSKRIDELQHLEFDYVVTLSDRVRRQCPAFRKNTKILHVGLESPPRLAANAATEEERLSPYRRVRDVIGELLDSLLGSLGERSA